MNLKEHSLAWEIAHDLKVKSKVYKLLLVLSIILNVVLIITH